MITKLLSAPKVECYIRSWRICTTHNTVFQDDLLSNTSLHSNPQVMGKKLSFSLWLFHFSTTGIVEIFFKKTPNILQGCDRNKAWKWKKNPRNLIQCLQKSLKRWDKSQWQRGGAGPAVTNRRINNR